MIFIEVHEGGVHVWVNAAQIEQIFDVEGRTTIQFANGGSMNVIENSQQILAQIPRADGK